MRSEDEKRGPEAPAGAAAGLAIASTAVFFDVILMGFGIYDIIKGSLELHRLRRSPAGDILRRLASELKEMTEGVDPTLLDDDIVDANSEDVSQFND